jgi:hypothetical protein
MKLKGLAKVIEMVEGLGAVVNHKIDNIEWSGDHDERDEQKDEMFNEALDLLERAKEELMEIQEIQLEDF